MVGVVQHHCDMLTMGEGVEEDLLPEFHALEGKDLGEDLMDGEV